MATLHKIRRPQAGDARQDAPPEVVLEHCDRLQAAYGQPTPHDR